MQKKAKASSGPKNISLPEDKYHTQKMEAIGKLAGGIAHDFNNILTAIIGYGGLLKNTIKEPPQLKYINNILESAGKAAKLIENLLALSRKQMINPKPVDANDIIGSVRPMLAMLLGDNIKLSLNLFDGKLTVIADSAQIEQVLNNLASNSRDAMPHGGSISISTSIADINESFVEQHGYGNPGTYVLLTFSDTGEGIDEKSMERIFEPFFTTKDVGKGKGLGLAIVYGIVKQHNGYIHVQSRTGKGTTFRIFLPFINIRSENQ